MKVQVIAAASALALCAAASAASAAVVMFQVGDDVRSTTFADGVFSYDLSGVRSDGFYGVSPFSAINGYGQNGEYIRFNGPVTLGSLSIVQCAACYNSNPTLFTVNLYDASAILIDSKSVSASSTEQTLTFNRQDVSKVEFTFSGTDGTNPYGDGRDVAWYQVSNISYFGVPEPATWAMMIGGFGLAGATLRRRNARSA